MTNKQLGPQVRAWLKGTDADPEDVRRSVGVLSGQVAQEPQRGRWWPLPLLHRQSRSIPTSDSHFPTVIGRTHSMISPAKAIIAGALVFGGAFLVAGPLQQQGSVPGAEAEPIAPTWVTGDIQAASSCSNPPGEIDGDVTRRHNVECNPQIWTSGDPRLAGDVSRRWNEASYRTEAGLFTVDTGAAYLRNDGGSWVCSSSGLVRGEGMNALPVLEAAVTTTFTCIGGGDYEGLSAVLVSQPTEGFSEEFVGLVFSGDIPPLPDPPTEE